MTTIHSAFSKSYAEARQKFLNAAQQAGLQVESHIHPNKGRDGEELAMDVAREGPLDAKHVLLVSSACHGVEGYCGSGVQVDALRSKQWHEAVAQSGVKDPTVVLLTPGAYHSAYFEHAFLAQQMGVELVEGQDLFVKDQFVYMRTTRGPKRVDVIYRRVDDDFLDPKVFRPTSTLGCPGLMEAYRAGNVAICNAVGTGVADDKSIYPYVPQMIEFYLGEKPILNNVPTYMCRKPEDLAYTLANLKDLVVKEVHGAGGYGMLVGPAATKAEIEEFRQVLIAKPDGYISQPTLSLSSCPTYVESGIAPRHIDLRPFVLSGKHVQMVPGGLTRVALKEGSLVVNSSQGGGTKDTWILEV